MNSKLKVFLIVELQVVLILLIVGILQIYKTNKRTLDTNKLLYRTMVDKETEELNVMNENDIVIGDKDAPLSIFVYSRTDCSACEIFFNESYYNIKSNFLNQGLAKMIIRYTVRAEKPLNTFATKCIHYAYKKGVFDDYTSYLSQYGISDSTTIKQGIINLVSDETDLNDYLNDASIDIELQSLSTNYRRNHIISTPTIFIGKERIRGTRPYAYYEQLIKSQLEIISCE